MPDMNSRNGEEVAIPPHKREETLKELRLIL